MEVSAGCGESAAIRAENCRRNDALAGMIQRRYLPVLGHVPQFYFAAAVDEGSGVWAEAGSQHFMVSNQWPRGCLAHIQQNEAVISMLACQEPSVWADRQGFRVLVGFRKEDLLRLRKRRVPHEGIELRS